MSDIEVIEVENPNVEVIEIEGDSEVITVENTDIEVIESQTVTNDRTLLSEFYIKINGFGSVFVPNTREYFEVPYNCNIIGWKALGNNGLSNGSLKLNVWKTTFDDLPADSGDSITGGNDPEIVDDIKASDDILEDWEIMLEEGDYLCFNIESAEDFTSAVITFKIIKT